MEKEIISMEDAMNFMESEEVQENWFLYDLTCIILDIIYRKKIREESLKEYQEAIDNDIIRFNLDISPIENIIDDLNEVIQKLEDIRLFINNIIEIYQANKRLGEQTFNSYYRLLSKEVQPYFKSIYNLTKGKLIVPEEIEEDEYY